jgi:hypothetical protein
MDRAEHRSRPALNCRNAPIPAIVVEKVIQLAAARPRYGCRPVSRIQTVAVFDVR